MATNLKNLPVEEKIRLVQDLWESIASDAAAVPVDPGQLAEVKQRLAQYQLDGDRGTPVEEAVERIRDTL